MTEAEWQTRKDRIDPRLDAFRTSDLFVQAGQEFKLILNRELSEDGVTAVVDLVGKLAKAVEEHGETDPDKLNEWQQFSRKHRQEGLNFREIGELWRRERGEG